MDGGAWQAAVHGVSKSQTQLSDFTFTFHFHALEKEVATHSSLLAWKIPGRGAWWAAVYGSHRVGHDWSDLAAAADHYDFDVEFMQFRWAEALSPPSKELYSFLAKYFLTSGTKHQGNQFKNKKKTKTVLILGLSCCPVKRRSWCLSSVLRFWRLATL